MRAHQDSVTLRNKRSGILANAVFGFLWLMIAGSAATLSSGAFVAVSHAQGSAILTEIIYSKLSGDNVQINLVTNGTVGEPGSFSTDNPARIALDFFGMQKQMTESLISIKAGQVDSVVAVETPDRTRIIINLFETARYDVSEAEDGYAITIYNTEFDNTLAAAPKPFATRSEIVSEISVTNLDFRRSPAGGGSLVVDLSDDSVTIDTRERDGEIIVDILATHLPKELERRLDVIDFATPVKLIDAFQNNDDVRLVIVPQGKYQHLSYQTGNRFNLIVDPIVEVTEDKRLEEDLALGFEGERLSLNFQKIEVRTALSVIADFTGINFVTSDTVRGEITINLNDVPWDQALEVIMRTRGLAKRQNGNVIWVAPAEEITKMEEEELKALAVVEEFAPLATELVQINYAKAADIALVIKQTKSVSQRDTLSGSSFVGDTNFSSSARVTQSDKNSLLTARGSVTVDERTNTLLVQDVAEKIKQLRNIISQLDKPVRQVMIETRIVEANDSFSRELGARLGFQRITENARFPGISDTTIGDFVGSGTTEGLSTIQNSRIDDEPGLIFDNSRGAPGGLAVDLGADSIGGTLPASYAVDLFRLGTGFAHLITLELSALEADGRGKIVASPRLITANQKEATISQGSEIFVTIPGNGGGAGGGGGGTGGGGLEKIEAELKLIVTPQITPDDRVILDVHIQQDQILGSQSGIQTLGTKEIITQILADNGETVIVGGIYQEQTNERETKVPFLGDIPFLGNLFKKKSKGAVRTELLIFLTPKIISPKLNLG